MQSNKNKIKISFVHDFFPSGGGEVVTSMLASYLTQKNYDIFVFAHEINNELLTDSDKKNINIIKINREDLFFKQINPKNTLINSCNNLEMDILIFVGNNSFNIKEISEHLSCKTIFAYHGTPFWEIENKKQQLAKHLTEMKGLKRLRHIYYKIPKEIYKLKHHLLSRFQEIYDVCDGFTVLCESYKTVFEERLNLDANNKITAISNAVAPAPINYCLSKKKQIIYMGRMSYADKRIDRLLDIWKNLYYKFPDWELLLIGDGPEKENLEEQAQINGLERIQFCGKTNKPFKYYNSASILCLTSQFEGIPLVLLEAQQAGVIPIAFNCSEGVASVLSPNWENGVLIDDFSMLNYENALCKLMSDENLRKQLQQNVLQKAQDYDIEKVGQAWHELFTKLLSE